MATQYITLADGTRIPVEGVNDPDAGWDYDFEGALNNAGYISIPGAGTTDYFNQNYGTNFTSPEQYLQWVYGGGGVENVTGDSGFSGTYFKTPSGAANTVNTPLSYDPQGMEFADYVLAGMGAVAGAGLTGMLPGTTNVFSGMTGGFSNPFSSLTNMFGGGGENVLNGMDLSGYMTGLDSGPGFFDPSLMSGVEGAAHVPGVHDFYGSLGENAGIGSTATNPLTGSAASSAIPGTGAMPAMGAGGSGSGILSGLGDFINSPLGSLIGKVAPSVLGYAGADKQSDMYRDMFNQYYGMGAPFRGKLLESYQPGFSLMNEPGFKDAMDTSFNTFMRAASAGNAQGVSSGNPFDNPGAIMESQKYLMGSLGLPYLTNYRSGLMGAGQLGLGPSADFGNAQIQADRGKYTAAGFGIDQVFNGGKNTGIQLGSPFTPPTFDPYRSLYKGLV